MDESTQLLEVRNRIAVAEQRLAKAEEANNQNLIIAYLYNLTELRKKEIYF